MHYAESWRRRTVADEKKGFTHAYTTEQLLAFRAIPTEEKLRWLGEMQQFLEATLTPERRELFQQFRRGEI